MIRIGLCFLILCNFAFAVEYRVTFESSWSEDTHPGASAGAASHFSTPVGGVHSDAVSFWELGGMASPAIESMAELGGTALLRESVEQQIAAGIASQSFIGSFMGNLPNSQTIDVDLSHEFSQLTFTSMIGPSSDWFVGVSGLSPLEDGQWLDEVTIELLPLDAGTEEGSAFQISNPATTPHQTIQRLDNDPESRFFELPPIASLTLERVPFCDFNADGICNAADLSTVDGLYSAGDLEVGVDVGGDVSERFDLNSDGVVDSQDLDQWLADAATVNGFAEPYLKGDTNLNDHVGFGDFTAFSDQFGVGREWTEGNYRGSGTSSFPDFLLLSRNFGEAIPRAAQSNQAGVSSVPEPEAMLTLIVGMVSILLLRKKRHG